MKRRLLLLLGLIPIAGYCLADVTSDKLRACANIDDIHQRVACYDGIVASLPQPSLSAEKPRVSKADEPAAAAGVAAITEQQDSFGKEHWESEREGTTIEANVVAVEKSGYGKLVVTLDNGQVWRQVRSEKIRISEGDRVTIERGVLNSFSFQINDINRKIKFTRLN
jgi:translation initiation factor IF-1